MIVLLLLSSIAFVHSQQFNQGSQFGGNGFGNQGFGGRGGGSFQNQGFGGAGNQGFGGAGNQGFGGVGNQGFGGAGNQGFGGGGFGNQGFGGAGNQGFGGGGFGNQGFGGAGNQGFGGGGFGNQGFGGAGNQGFGGGGFGNQGFGGAGNQGFGGGGFGNQGFGGAGNQGFGGAGNQGFGGGGFGNQESGEGGIGFGNQGLGSTLGETEGYFQHPHRRPHDVYGPPPEEDDEPSEPKDEYGALRELDEEHDEYEVIPHAKKEYGTPPPPEGEVPSPGKEHVAPPEEPVVDYDVHHGGHDKYGPYKSVYGIHTQSEETKIDDVLKIPKTLLPPSYGANKLFHRENFPPENPHNQRILHEGPGDKVGPTSPPPIETYTGPFAPPTKSPDDHKPTEIMIPYAPRENMRPDANQSSPNNLPKEKELPFKIEVNSIHYGMPDHHHGLPHPFVEPPYGYNHDYSIPSIVNVEPAFNPNSYHGLAPTLVILDPTKKMYNLPLPTVQFATGF